MIYICIPAFNEARTVGVLLWRVRQVMDELRRDYHVLVLDDGSTDDTPEVLAPYPRVLPLTIFRNEKTQGYAAALERLIREAVHRSTHPKRDAVIVLQADFTENPEDIAGLVKRLEGGADVVGTTVTESEGELPRGLRWGRKGLPWLLGRGKFPKEIRDPLSGYRAYRVAVLKRALQERDGKPLLTRGGWAANAELLLQVAPHARRSEDSEVRLRYTRRERETRFSPWSTAVELWDLARKTKRRPALAPAAAPAVAAVAEKPSAPPPQAAATVQADAPGALPPVPGTPAPPGQGRRRRGRGGSRRGGGRGPRPPAVPE